MISNIHSAAESGDSSVRIFSFTRPFYVDNKKSISRLFVQKKVNVVNARCVRNARLVQQCKKDLPGSFSTILERTRFNSVAGLFANGNINYAQLEKSNGDFSNASRRKYVGFEKTAQKPQKIYHAAMNCLAGGIKKPNDRKEIKRLNRFFSKHIESKRQFYIKPKPKSNPSKTPDYANDVAQQAHETETRNPPVNFQLWKPSAVNASPISGLIDIVLLRFIFGKMFWSQTVRSSCKSCKSVNKYVMKKNGFFYFKVDVKSFYNVGCLDAKASFGTIDQLIKHSKTFQKITNKKQNFAMRVATRGFDGHRNGNNKKTICDGAGRFRLEESAISIGGSVGTNYWTSNFVSRLFNIFSFFLISPVHLYVGCEKINFYDNFLVELSRRYILLKNQRHFENKTKNKNPWDLSDDGAVREDLEDKTENSFGDFAKNKNFTKASLDLKYLLNLFEEKIVFSKNKCVTISRLSRQNEIEGFIKSAESATPELLKLLELSLNLHKMFYLSAGEFDSEPPSTNRKQPNGKGVSDDDRGNGDDNCAGNGNFEDFPKKCSNCKQNVQYRRFDGDFVTENQKSKKLFNKLLQRFVTGSNGPNVVEKSDFKKESSVIVQLTYSDRISLLMIFMDVLKSEFLVKYCNKIEDILKEKKKIEIEAGRNEINVLFQMDVENDFSHRDGFKKVAKRVGSFSSAFKRAVSLIYKVFGFLLTKEDMKILLCFLDDNDDDDDDGNYKQHTRAERYCKTVFNKLNSLKSGMDRKSEPDNAFAGYDRKQYDISEKLGIDPVYCMSNNDEFSQISSIFLEF